MCSCWLYTSLPEPFQHLWYNSVRSRTLRKPGLEAQHTTKLLICDNLPTRGRLSSLKSAMATQ